MTGPLANGTVSSDVGRIVGCCLDFFTFGNVERFFYQKKCKKDRGKAVMTAHP